MLLFRPPFGAGILLPTEGDRNFGAVGPDLVMVNPAAFPGKRTKIINHKQILHISCISSTCLSYNIDRNNKIDFEVTGLLTGVVTGDGSYI